jgi:hypothetical protein
MGLTESEFEAPLLENPLFNGALLQDLANMWMQMKHQVQARSSMSSTCQSLGTKARHRPKQHIKNVQMSQEAIQDALVRVGLVQSSSQQNGRSDMMSAGSLSDENLVTGVLHGNARIAWGIVVRIMGAWQRIQAGTCYAAAASYSLQSCLPLQMLAKRWLLCLHVCIPCGGCHPQ